MSLNHTDKYHIFKHIRLISEERWVPKMYTPVQHLIPETLQPGTKGMFLLQRLHKEMLHLKGTMEKPEVLCRAQNKAVVPRMQPQEEKEPLVSSLWSLVHAIPCTWNAFFPHSENSFRAQMSSLPGTFLDPLVPSPSFSCVHPQPPALTLLRCFPSALWGLCLC